MQTNIDKSTLALLVGHSADAVVTGAALAHEKGNVIEGNRLIRVLAVEVARYGKEPWEHLDWFAAGAAVASVKIAAAVLVVALIWAGRDHLEAIPHAAKYLAVLAAVGFAAAVTNLGVMFA